MFRAQIPIKNSPGHQLSLTSQVLLQRNGKIHQLTVCTLSKVQRTKYHKKCSRDHLDIFHQIKINSIDEISDHLNKNSKKKRLSMNGVKKFPNVKIDKR